MSTSNRTMSSILWVLQWGRSRRSWPAMVFMSVMFSRTSASKITSPGDGISSVLSIVYFF